MTDLATLGLRIDSSEVPKAANDLDHLATAARKTEAATDKMTREIDKAERAAGGMSKAFRVMAPILAAVTAAMSIGALRGYADAWSDMQSRVGAAVKDMSAAPALMKRMVDLANSSYSPLEQTVEVYTRNVAVLRDLGVSAAGAADFTESLNHMLVITATRGERAASVQNALSKAMAVGKLEADGLESVLSNGGRVAEALAKELGTTTSGLRAMASEGKITGAVIANALLGSLEDVRVEAGKMPATIGDAFTRINNNVLQFVGTLDQTYGVSSRVAEAMLGMADAIQGAIGPAVGIIDGLIENFERGLAYATAFAAYMAGAWVVSFVAAGGAVAALNAALVIMRGAMIRTGIGALIVLAGELVYQLYDITKGATSVAQALGMIGNSAVQSFNRVMSAAGAVDQFLYGTAMNVRAYFLQAFADIAQSAIGMLNSIMGLGNQFSMALTGPLLASMQGAKDASAQAGQAFDNAGKLWNSAFEDMSKVTTDLGEFPDVMTELSTTTTDAGDAVGGLGGASLRAVDPVNALGGAVGGAGASAAAANTELDEFISNADQLAEKLFPGEYAIKEAQQLQDMLEKYGSSLDSMQTQGVKQEITDLFKAGELGVRNLEDTTKDGVGNMADEFKNTLGSILGDLFSSPIEGFDDFMDRVLGGLGQLGQQNLQMSMDMLFGTGGTDPAAGIAGAVQSGAEAGTEAGAEGGIFSGLGAIFGGDKKPGAQGGSPLMGALGSAAGGLGIGYAAQDPMMGAVGGALSGIAGGPLGIAAGAIGGLIGGLFGAAKAAKEAKMALEKMRGEIDNLIDVGEGRGLGEMTKSFRDFAKQSYEFQEAAAKAKDSELQKRLQNAVNSFFGFLSADFNLAFQGTVDALTSGEGLGGAFVSAQQEVLSMREELKGFVADTQFMNEKFGELAMIDWATETAAAVATAEKAAQSYALSVLAGAHELTEFEEGLAEASGRASALQVTLEQLGMSATDAANAITGALNMALAKLKDEYIADLNASINDLSGFGFLNDMVEAQKKYQDRLRDSAALGLDGSLALREFNLSLADIVQGADLTQAQIDMLAKAFPAMAGLIETVAGQDAMATVADARAELERAYDAEASAINDVISRTERFITSIKQFRDSMRLDDTSPLSQEQQFLEAQRQYRETLALANGGDEEAMGRLTDVSQAYLDEAREYYASSERYAEVWNEIDRTLAETQVKAVSQLDIARSQLSALDASVAGILNLNSSVLSVGQAIAALAGAQARSDAALQAQIAATQNQGANQIQEYFRTILGRDGSAKDIAWYANSGKSMQQIEADLIWAKQHGAMAMGGIVGRYQTGGLVGNGIYDVDSVLARYAGGGNIALAGGEHVTRATSVNSTTRPMLDHINRTGMAPSNNNGDVVAELRAVRAELADLKSEMARQTSTIVLSDNATRDLQSEGNRALNTLSKSSKRDTAVHTRKAG